MLLAPMLFEDEVLGVLVLSKLGLHQFTDDDLRLLVIYASFAAQAMANADTTERLREQSAALERQVREPARAASASPSRSSRRSTAPAVLEGITDRLGQPDRVRQHRHRGRRPGDRPAHAAHGPRHPCRALPRAVGSRARPGSRPWVVEHNEPVYISDERHDDRVNQFRGFENLDGSLIVVPLRGRSGAIGVLTIERLGAENPFAPEEFDLVTLFAAQVSIALQNAEVFRDVEIRAQTDGLTGLLNRATFEDYLAPPRPRWRRRSA